MYGFNDLTVGWRPWGWCQQTRVWTQGEWHSASAHCLDPNFGCILGLWSPPPPGLPSLPSGPPHHRLYHEGIFNLILQKKGLFLMITGTLLLLTSLEKFGLVPVLLTQEFWITYFLLFIVQHIPVIKHNNFSTRGDLLCAEQNKLKRTDKSHSFGRNGSSSDL